MTKSELKIKLDNLGIDEQSYALNGGLWDERYVLNQEPGGKWSVYYSERGDRVGVEYFENENDACEYLIRRIEKDPTTRIKAKK